MSGGVEVIRQAVRARKISGAVLARELGISAEALGNFAHGQGTLPTSILQALAREIWAGAIAYDSNTDLLHAATKHIPKTNTPPTPYVPAPTTRYAARVGHPGPQPVIKTKPLPKAPRAGWAE